VAMARQINVPSGGSIYPATIHLHHRPTNQPINQPNNGISVTVSACRHNNVLTKMTVTDFVGSKKDDAYYVLQSVI